MDVTPLSRFNMLASITCLHMNKFIQHDINTLLYLDLGMSVPLGASGDEKPPSSTVTGDPSGSMPAGTHLFQDFIECTSAQHRAMF